MRYPICILVEVLIVISLLCTLYSLIPAPTEPIFRPVDVIDSYRLDNKVFRPPYTNSNPPARSFEEPDFGLLTSPAPSHYTCSNDSNPHLFIGIFSTPASSARRSLIRSLMSSYFESVGKTVLEYKFVIGKSAQEDDVELEDEQLAHNDILTLPTPENMDNGKTYHYFKALLELHTRNASFTPQFVAKCDDDTLLIIPAVLNSLASLNCDENVYWGTSAGRSAHFPEYFRGLAYILSWPLVGWIGGSDISGLHRRGVEDARTGQWLQTLQYIYPKQPLLRVDNAWNMGDWNQMSIQQNTLALHWLKLDDWWKRQAELVAEAWKFEDGHWEWQGLPSQEEEDSRKEEHRLAVIEKTRVREETEKSGKTFDDELYNKVHPEVLDGF